PAVRELLGGAHRERPRLGERGRERRDAFVREPLLLGVGPFLILHLTAARVEARGLLGQRAALLGGGVRLPAEPVPLGPALREPRRERQAGALGLALAVAQGRQSGLAALAVQAQPLEARLGVGQPAPGLLEPTAELLLLAALREQSRGG